MSLCKHYSAEGCEKVSFIKLFRKFDDEHKEVPIDVYEHEICERIDKEDCLISERLGKVDCVRYDKLYQKILERLDRDKKEDKIEPHLLYPIDEEFAEACKLSETFSARFRNDSLKAGIITFPLNLNKKFGCCANIGIAISKYYKPKFSLLESLAEEMTNYGAYLISPLAKTRIIYGAIGEIALIGSGLIIEGGVNLNNKEGLCDRIRRISLLTPRVWLKMITLEENIEISQEDIKECEDKKITGYQIEGAMELAKFLQAAYGEFNEVK